MSAVQRAGWGIVTCLGPGLIIWERDHLEDPGADERIILRWIFRKWDEGHGLD